MARLMPSAPSVWHILRCYDSHNDLFTRKDSVAYESPPNTI
jgi:hypothetical protein